MRIRKLTAFLLILLLAAGCAPAAFSAPQREAQAMAFDPDEGLQTILDILAAALADAEETGCVLPEGAAPAPALGERMLAAAALKCRPTTFLTWAEAETLYRQLFTAGAYTPGEAPAAAGMLFQRDGIALSPDASGACGAYLYAVEDDGADVTVDCDFFVSDVTLEDGGEISLLPEDAVLWLRGAEVSLRKNAEAEFGYTVNGIVLTPRYESGCSALWREETDEAAGYSLRLPEFLLPGENAGEWRSADGSAAVQIRRGLADMSFDEAEKAFEQAHPGCRIAADRAFSCMEALGEGEYHLTVLAEDTGSLYALTLRFPAERQAEYAFYAELIRNSFIVWELANG